MVLMSRRNNGCKINLGCRFNEDQELSSFLVASSKMMTCSSGAKERVDVGGELKGDI